MDRQVIWEGHYHCEVCGAVTSITIYDDGNMNMRAHVHDFNAHMAVYEKLAAARWN